MFLTSGKKIVNLRKKYKITQGELAKYSVSRTTLGILESDKRCVSEFTEKIIVNAFNKIFLEKNINFSINVGYFSETLEEQAIRFLDEILVNKNKIRDNIFDIDLAISHLSKKNKLKYLDAIYKIFYYLNENNLAFKYIYDLVVLKNDNLSMEDLTNFFKILEKNNKFDEIDKFYNKYFEKIDGLNSDDQFEINRIYIKSLENIEKFGIVEEKLSILYKKEKNINIKQKYKMLLAEYYLLTKNIEKYAKIFATIATKKEELASKIYSDIVYNAAKFGQIDIIQKYIYKCEKHIEKEKNEKLYFEIYFKLGMARIALDHFKKAKICLDFSYGRFEEEVNNKFIVEFTQKYLKIIDYSHINEVQQMYDCLKKNNKIEDVKLDFVDWYRINDPIELQKIINDMRE